MKMMNFLQAHAMRARMKRLVRQSSVWLLISVLLLGRPGIAHGQFGIDLGVIEAGLQAILSVLKSSVGGPLQAIEAIERSWTQYQQTTIYPQSSILQAQSAVAGFALPMQQMNQIVSINYASAQLPVPQQLEQQLLSGDPNQVANLGAAYHQVYGNLPANTQAPEHVQNSIDITDAEAQDGPCATRRAGRAAAQSADSAGSSRLRADSRSRCGGLGRTGKCLYPIGDGGAHASAQRKYRESRYHDEGCYCIHGSYQPEPSTDA
jgi:hypothetical protein